MNTGTRYYDKPRPGTKLTASGGLAYFALFLKTTGLFDRLCSDFPVDYKSNNSCSKRDIVGTMVLAILFGKDRYVQINALRNDTAAMELLGLGRIASHSLTVALKPGESRDLVFTLGYIELPEEQKWQKKNVVNKKPAKAILKKFDTAAKVDRAFAQLRKYWDDLLARYSVTTGNDRLDRMVNIWNQYQCMITFNMSRSASFFESGIGRGMGFRDSNQDLVGFVHQIPERARERIIDIASTQFPDGGCYHQYQPLTKRGNNDIGGGFNDDPMWLIFGTVAYLKETGDFSILDEKVPFDNQPGSEVSLMEHLRVSFNHVIEVKNPKGVEKGVASVVVDGKPIDGQTVPRAPGRHKVVVTMG